MLNWFGHVITHENGYQHIGEKSIKSNDQKKTEKDVVTVNRRNIKEKRKKWNENTRQRSEKLEGMKQETPTHS